MHPKTSPDEDFLTKSWEGKITHPHISDQNPPTSQQKGRTSQSQFVQKQEEQKFSAGFEQPYEEGREVQLFENYPKRQKSRKPLGEENRFVDELIISQSISINDEQINNEANQNLNNFLLNKEEMIREGQKKKESWFNIMLVGGSGTGKTTFKQCFLKHYKQKNSGAFIKNHTIQLQSERAPPNFIEPNLNVSVIDTPGYSLATFYDYSQIILRQIQERIERDRKSSKNEDEKIHCILFFLKGPRTNQLDWKLLSQIQNLININMIPIVAKGDIYTIEEIREFKKQFREMTALHQIKWFDVEEYIRQKHPEEQDSLLKGPYGTAPPFVISTSTVQIQSESKLKVGRQYKWGICYTQNSEHTDFLLLNRILLKFLRQPLIQHTNIKKKAWLQNLKEKEKKRVLRKVMVFGIGTVALSALIYKFNRQMIKEIK